MTDYSKFFKAYDVRGSVPLGLEAKLFYLSGKGLVEVILKAENRPTTVVMCHDGRYSSNEFYSAFCQGVHDAGGDTISLGLGSTDFMYAGAQIFGFTSVNITASHNPKDDNGFKIVKEGSTMLGLEDGLDKVRDYVVQNYPTSNPDLTSAIYPTVDEEKKTKVKEYFLDKIIKIGKVKETDDFLAKIGKKLTIPVDAGNGVGGWVMEHFGKDLYKNIEFVPMYWDVDGSFPNHPADPTNFATLADLQQKVLELKSPCGVAFDGDGDRAVFVDEKAAAIQGDYMCAEFAANLLQTNQKNPNTLFNNAAVYITPGSRCNVDAITENNGAAIPSKQGHTFIKKEMEKYKAIYGGEYSGHHYFGEFGYMDSGIITMCLMLNIMAERNGMMSDIFEKLSKEYFLTPLINLDMPAGQNFQEWVKTLKEKYSDAMFSELDGLSVYYLDWKFNMRSSNTEPKVRFVVETKGVDKLDQKVKEIKAVLGI
jgi:phosphomannomutase